MNRELRNRRIGADDVAEGVVENDPVMRSVRVDTTDVVLGSDTGCVLENAVFDESIVRDDVGLRRILAHLEHLLIRIAKDTVANDRRPGVLVALDLHLGPSAPLQGDIVELKVAAVDEYQVAHRGRRAHRVALYGD